MNVLEQFLKKASKSTSLFVEHSLCIAHMLNKYMEENKLTNAKFADKLGIKKRKLAHFMGGLYNFSLQEISEIEAKIGIRIISIKKIKQKKPS